LAPKKVKACGEQKNCFDVPARDLGPIVKLDIISPCEGKVIGATPVRAAILNDNN
jgi:hypothetical protein